MERFNRQIKLPELGQNGQQKLQSAKVLVAGAGGLGCPAILYLAAAGVGTIGIADGDCISVSNLNRQILFGHRDIGFNKASVAAQFIAERYPDIRVESYDEYLSLDNLPYILPRYDLIIDGSDNFSTRYLLNDAAVVFGKPLVYGAVYKFEGQVAVFNAKNGSATYRDLFPFIPAPGEIPDCSDGGVLGVLPGIIGTMQAAEAIKWITGIGKPLINRVLFFNLKENSLYEIELTPHPDSQKQQASSLDELLQTDYSVTCPSEIEISWKTAIEKAKREDAVFVDIRYPYELPRWKNERCREIPMTELHEKADSIASSNTVFLFCQHGIRSRVAAIELRQRWVKQTVFSIEGGVEHHDSPVK